jgi:TonB family protein
MCKSEKGMANKKKITAVAVSLAVHVILLAAIILHDVWGLFRSVEDFEVGDYGGRPTVRLINPADYGYGRKPRLAAPPRRPAPLEKLKQRKKPEPEKVEEKSQPVEESTEKTVAEASAEQPKFGRLDTHPIKQHVARLWQAHEQGALDIPDTFSVMAACKVNPDGSFSDIRLIESSGSEELDRTALAILIEVGNQRAFAPLSRLTSVSVRLEVASNSAAFSLVGFAPNAATAADMAGQYQTMISAARLFVSNAQTRELLKNTSVRNELSRVSASVRLPRSAAAQMMHDGFSKSD